MGLSDLLKKTETLLKKEEDNKTDYDDFSQSKSLFADIRYQQSNLDESIRVPLEQMEQKYEEEESAIRQERIIIEEKRKEIVNTVLQELTNLKKAYEVLEATQENRFANHFLDAKRACENRINEYTNLLKRLDTEFSDESKSNFAHVETLKEDLSALTELQTKADAINMLVSITPRQKQALIDYTSEYGPVTYKQMNGYLRGRMSSNETSPETKTSIGELHNLLKDQVTRRPITVYRTVSADAGMVSDSSNISSLNQYNDHDLVGKLLFDGGFVSTSLDLYSTRPGTTKLIIDLPAGTQGTYVGDISSFKEQENEFLMDCKQAFRVTKVERKDGMRLIYVKSLRKTDESLTNPVKSLKLKRL